MNYNKPCECCGSQQTSFTSYGCLCGWCLQDLKEKDLESNKS